MESSAMTSPQRICNAGSSRWAAAIITFVAAIILLSSVLLKIGSLLEVLPGLHSGITALDVLAIPVNFGVALVLLGFPTPFVRRTACLVFSTYAFWQAAAILQGSSSCGCFGVVQPDARIIFVLDSVLAVSLFAAAYMHSSSPRAAVFGTQFGAALLLSGILSWVSIIALAPVNKGKPDGADNWAVPTKLIAVPPPARLLGQAFPIPADMLRSVDPRVSHFEPRDYTHIVLLRSECRTCAEIRRSLTAVLEGHAEGSGRKLLVVYLDKDAPTEWPSGIDVCVLQGDLQVACQTPSAYAIENWTVVGALDASSLALVFQSTQGASQ